MTDTIQRYNANSFSVWGFIKGFGKLLIGFLLLLQGILGLILLLAVVAIVTNFNGNFAGNNDKLETVIEADSAFILNPVGVITELAPERDSFEDLIESAYGIQEPSRIAISDVIKSIRAAKDDKRIKAMVIDFDSVGISGTSKVYTLIDEIKEFKTSGKKVYAIGNFFGQSQYLVASHADEILMNKSGGLSLYGYGVYRTYYKSLLEKLKITTHVFRVGTFKAAVEPQLRDDMSPEAKVANQEFVDALWSKFTQTVATNRNITPEMVNRYADQYNEVLKQYGGDDATAALESGLVDRIERPSAIRKYLIELFGESSNEDRDFKYVTFKPYLATLNKDVEADKDRVAIVTAAGTIMPGRSIPGQTAGSVTIVDYLKKARKDEKVKAVVLRVDSPGGSAFASEVIHDSILELQAAGKPVIVSMGSLAASGGYLIAAPADEIWAAPTTITGSIGIFATFNTLENLAAEAGVYTDGVGTTSQASILGAGIGPLPETTKEAFQLTTESGYDDFLTIVAEGRGLEKSYVDSVGQGRIWTGERALDLKLVDNLGDLDDAVAAAAAKAELTDYTVTRFEDRRTPWERLIGGASAQIVEASGLHRAIAKRQQSGIGQLLNAVDEHADFLASFNDPNNLYMRCLPCEGVTQSEVNKSLR